MTSLFFQLALLASYSGDELGAIYRYFRSLAVDSPFTTARENLIVAFEKVMLTMACRFTLVIVLVVCILFFVLTCYSAFIFFISLLLFLILLVFFVIYCL